MDSTTFLRTLLATEPRKLRTLWKTQPDKGALKLKLNLMDGADSPSERFARATLCQLWGVHGLHREGVSLMQTLEALPNERAPLFFVGRDRLSQRLHEALSRAKGPTDYTALFADLKYFGPKVRQRWTLEALKGETKSPSIPPSQTFKE